MSQLVPLNKTSLIIPVFVRDSSGQPIAADATPTITNVQVNGADASEGAVTVAQAQDAGASAVTGLYNVTVNLTTLALSDGDDVTIYVTAAIAGVSATNVYTFTVTNIAAGSASIQFGS